MRQSIGLLEVIGLATATACADQMVKSAFIEIVEMNRVQTGMICVIIQGDLASVQVALEVGLEEATKMGEIVAVKTIPKPFEGLDRLFTWGGADEDI